MNRVITISNHTSSFDWIFIFAAMLHFGRVDDLFIMMKKSIGDIPVIAYFVRTFEFILLSRNRDADIPVITKALQKYSKYSKYNLFFYPEGTYVGAHAISGLIEFLRSPPRLSDKKLFVPHRVLIPRQAGFEHALSKLSGTYEGIIDVTVLTNPYVYDFDRTFTLSDILLGESLNLGQILIINFIEKENVSKDFLMQSFQRKERLIEEYVKFTCCEALHRISSVEKLAAHMGILNKNIVIISIPVTSKYKKALVSIGVTCVLLLLLSLTRRYLILSDHSS